MKKTILLMKFSVKRANSIVSLKIQTIINITLVTY